MQTQSIYTQILIKDLLLTFRDLPVRGRIGGIEEDAVPQDKSSMGQDSFSVPRSHKAQDTIVTDGVQVVDPGMGWPRRS